MSSVRIGDVVRFQRGVSWSADQEHRHPGAGRVPVLRIPNIQENLTTSDLVYLSGIPDSVRERTAASKGWILAVGSNGNPDRIGNAIIIEDESDFLFASFLVGIKCDQRRVLGRYLLRLLNSDDIRSYLRVTMRGSTGLQNINLPALSDFRIKLPPLPAQQRIVEILDALDAQISLAERTVEKLKLVREGLVKDLLSCGVNGDGRLRDPHKESSEFRDTVLGLIPRGWRIATCGALSREIVVGIVIRPTQYYRSSGVPVLRSANVRASGLDVSDVVYMSLADHAAMGKSAVKPGDLVTVRTGYPGTTAVIPQSLPSANCVDIIITRPGSEVCPDYLSLWVNSDLGKGQVLRAQGGLAQQHFNVSEMKSLLVAVPPLAEQAVIASRAAAADRRLADEVRELMKLTTLRKGLIADLLTGRVHVPVEAAS
ncbi:hypothetical protein GCM10010103_20520 [Streptomyces paradoxus]|uniref:Type I restriction enzyme S subunit n=1 Tax=Streptomyces paradoxus TaxID=66375 RepID=A0A7W9TBS0_9ACTN|nr:restriction endonuclease subunit S [Streptomyces paradoxus]MBB6076902.1 type I restriction enzyme S subunit [Streptomyces paradoxus]